MRYLIVRLGAIGDCIGVTPLIRYLHEQGNEVYVLTSEQGMEVFKNNPRISKLVLHVRDSVDMDSLGDYFEQVQKDHNCHQLIDLCEVWECNLALHPNDPRYKYPLQERREICDKNYYEEVFVKAGVGWYESKFGPEFNYKPEMFFAEDEETEMSQYFSRFIGCYKILWGLSGSSRQKTYPTPYMEICLKKLKEEFNDVIHFTVGDDKCQVLEWAFKDNAMVNPHSGEWTIRQAILACKYVNLVIAPDTGLLHGSACFDTPKIAILTNTSLENITKHFKNTHSLTPDGLGCAPCFQLIYEAKIQSQISPVDHTTPMCMATITPDKILNKIREIRNATMQTL